MPTTSFAQVELDLLCNEILSTIEIRESRQIGWGFMDVRSDLRAELGTLLETLAEPARGLWYVARDQGVTVGDILDNLRDRKLIFESRGAYRTRFAETVRLLYLLRQRFGESDWQTASRLVSDLKIHLQRRRYPQRDLTPADLLEHLRGVKVPSGVLDAVGRLLQTEKDAPLRLARFQHDAIVRILQHLQEPGDHALAIGAGTGAGKTKAFYVPALAAIAARLSDTRSVQVLALYPRIELLKDQLAEAYAEARKLDGLLTQQGKRPLALGAYYGDTPQSAQGFLGDHPPANWHPIAARDGWICPYFFCPNPDCEGRDLVWTREDVEKEANANKAGKYGQYARLRCPHCGSQVRGDELMLTRDQMVRAAPDVLFTTTEMLNRRLSRATEHALFGVDVANPPRLMLLDEIHTYEGLTGAQVAYLLRRWRYARRHQPGHGLCIVGLSATLTDAEAFLSKLTGMPPFQVGYIAPLETDLVEEGLEYNLVLKGDPVSATSLLSTSVQTIMLLERMLDPTHTAVGSVSSDTSVSHGAYGKRTFAFTDNLDVINRWYHVEYDAEIRKVLSRLRKRDSRLSLDEQRRRNSAGQDWSICALIGHDLEAPLRVGLTSSQNPGVRADADVIVATSTLEVGFNDPTVGAIIQHKAPRSMASFLQRKGRAGRRREMRPWMVVVTSAYGRDRWAFQHAENLFNPVLPPLDLPIENAYVRKIQATYAFMDWLSLTLKKQHCTADIWAALASGNQFGQQQYEWPRKLIAKLVQEVLEGPRLEELTHYLQGALGISDAERERTIAHLLWNEPRSLLFSVLPTLLRQLETGWQSVVHGRVYPRFDAIAANPLPDFVPPNLFSDLNVPELVLRIPDSAQPRPSESGTAVSHRRKGQSPRAARSGAEARPAGALVSDTSPGIALLMRPDESIALLQGMTEFAPGRVSKRYASRDRTSEAHWLPLPQPKLLRQTGQLPLEQLTIIRQDTADLVNIDGTEYKVVRPRAYTLAQVPPSVRDTSNAWLYWRSRFLPMDHRDATRSPSGDSGPADDAATSADEEHIGNQLPVPAAQPLGTLVCRITAYSQGGGTWVDVMRLATGVRAETRYANGSETRQSLSFSLAGTPAALGFQLSVDALAFEFAPFDVHRIRESASWPTLYHHLGPQYFLHKLQADARLAALSPFEIEWLWQLTLSMLVATAVASDCPLEDAARELVRVRIPLAERTMKVIFQRQEVDDEDDEQVGRLHEKLLNFLAEPSIQATLDEHVAVLWHRDDPNLDEWLGACYSSSLGAAIFAAVSQLVPDIDPDDLILDVDGGHIWISEASPGGVGLIARIADAIARRPRDLDLQFQDIVRTCEREQLASQLHTIATLIGDGNATLRDAFAAMRVECDLPQHLRARERLARMLENLGLPATRELIVALTTKFLRPNSDTDSDRLIAALVRAWDGAEKRLGTAIDLRVMAVAALKIPTIAEHLREVLRRVGGPGAQADESQMFNLLQSLLWLSCADSCPDCIEHRQPFQQLAHPSRALLLAYLDIDVHPIVHGSPSWEQQVRAALATDSCAHISCEQDDLPTCKQDLLGVISQPVEVGFQLFYPIVERIARKGRQWYIDLMIAELIE